MLKSIDNVDFETTSLHRTLAAAKEKAFQTGRTQLVFIDQWSPGILTFDGFIINKCHIFLHPDGRITSTENRNSAFKRLKDFKGEVYTNYSDELYPEELSFNYEA